jgi:hypothetical protein
MYFQGMSETEILSLFQILGLKFIFIQTINVTVKCQLWYYAQ